MKINIFGIVSIVLFTTFAVLLVEMYGELPEERTEPYGVFDLVYVFLCLVFIFGLGRYSKFEIEK